MNEAPKKIWVEHEEGCWPTVMSDEHQGTGTQYIRADLVDGLVDVMQECIDGMMEFYELNKQTTKARAALKALEEE